MKKEYDKPIIEIVEFDKEDCIATSSTGEIEWWEE